MLLLASSILGIYASRTKMVRQLILLNGFYVVHGRWYCDHSSKLCKELESFLSIFLVFEIPDLQMGWQKCNFTKDLSFIHCWERNAPQKV